MAEVEIVNFSADDMLQMMPSVKSDEQKEIIIKSAQLNQTAGPGYTFRLNGEPVGCFGIRILGIGEGWAYFASNFLEHRITILRQSLELLEKMQREHKLWHIWTDPVDENPIGTSSQLQREDFARFLGFRKKNNIFVK